MFRVFVDPSPPSLQLRHFTTLSIEARFCQSEVEVPNDEDDAVLVLGLLLGCPGPAWPDPKSRKVSTSPCWGTGNRKHCDNVNTWLDEDQSYQEKETQGSQNLR